MQSNGETGDAIECRLLHMAGVSALCEQPQEQKRTQKDGSRGTRACWSSRESPEPLAVF